jgi:hypothetical protein
LSSQKKSSAEKSEMEGAQIVNMRKFTESDKNTHAQGGTRGNDSEEEGDDEEGGHGPGVGCQQQ